mmetsp:Transcript_33870/g.103958  ORF Transcript_33870/g.103958 Transcript_33870/m.103958 type:complete len:228 (-) Transcript_33870:43-726(-)
MTRFHYMTMLRDPFRRLVSAFYHSKRRKVECPTLARGASLLDFARCRNETGPRGCATKMLVGRACEALGPASKRGSASTPAAVRRGSSVGLGVSNPRRSSSAGVSADRRTRAGGSLSFGGRGRAGQGPTRRVFLRRPQRRLDGQRLPGPFPLWKADVRGSDGQRPPRAVRPQRAGRRGVQVGGRLSERGLLRLGGRATLRVRGRAVRWVAAAASAGARAGARQDGPR